MSLTNVNLDPITRQITPYTVSFLAPGKDRDGRDALLDSGSGVFISIAGITGILTAAHVIREILKHPECCLLLIDEKQGPAPDMRFKVAPEETLQIGSSDDRSGSDLGFVRLPQELEGWIFSKALIYNFDTRLSKATDVGPDLTNEVITGVIAERTFNKDFSVDKRRDVHSLTLAYGSSFDYRATDHNNDLFNFVLQHNENVPTPKSYGGLSGGAVWLAADEPGVNNLFLKGIVFYEDWSDELQCNYVICNGPFSIYRTLANAVETKFGRFAHK